ncbi:MAG: hypothetical protein SXA11_21575 [Cyanobacteriota bacterium]|nr:hypothetical protein [Cyanobacteriota bacterium]
MEIKTENYSVRYEEETTTVILEGSLRLNGMQEYGPIVKLLNDVVESGVSTITLNLKQLEFLNSSGINVLSKFAIEVRKKKNIKLIVKASKTIPWQAKSLKNLQRLLPTLSLEVE